MNVWDLIEGDQIAEQFVLGPISQTDIVRYQGASGDFQPIHHDQGFAQAAGYDAPLGIGLYPAGAASIWAAEFFGPETVRETSVRWSGMVWPGDVITGTARIDSADDNTRCISMTLANSRNEIVITLKMRFVRDG